MIVLDEFETVRREVADLEREKERAIGALRQVRRSVAEEFGVDDGVQLRKKVAELAQEESVVAAEWNAKFAAWRKKWAHVLKRRKESKHG